MGYCVSEYQEGPGSDPIGIAVRQGYLDRDRKHACVECRLECRIGYGHITEGGLEAPGGTNVPEELG